MCELISEDVIADAAVDVDDSYGEDMKECGCGCCDEDNYPDLDSFPEGTIVQANPAYWGDMIHGNEPAIFKIVGTAPSEFYPRDAVVLEQISGPDTEIIGKYIPEEGEDYLYDAADDEENVSPIHAVSAEPTDEEYVAFFFVR